ncbi:fasciclin domain-containing protein [Dysgonomonas sp. ZJ279]|uniref:fasciclin domain-containing protein n=1 Tax=Dysgonomonas sp. ZJ279 TaxID=2709796 RepID=UPI0013EE0ED9|nr:fasciclin domain-containing protein [Dysgonomonas sp. ZJ279]
MRKLRSLFYTLFVCSLFLVSCSDDDSEDKGGSEPKKEVEQIVSALESDKSLSDFTTALKTIDSDAIGTDQVTIFAFKNEALKSQLKASLDITQEVLKRHIVKGIYTLDKLKETKTLTTLGGETLTVIVYEETVYINGIPLKDSKNVSKSILFTIDKLIPAVAIDPTKEIVTFRVFETNRKWSTENSAQGTLIKGVSIRIFDNGTVIQTLTTDKDGLASFSWEKGKQLSFKAKNDTLNNIYNGLLVLGLFTTQTELDNAPEYKLFKEKKALGGWKFADINGDGIINNDDEIDYCPLSSESSIIDIYLVPEEVSILNPEPKQITDEDINASAKKYEEVYNEFVYIDTNLSDLDKRKNINSSEPRILNHWNLAYKSMRVNNYLINTVDQTPSISGASKVNQVKGYRALTYFQLITLFGDVPLMLESITSISDDNFYPSRTKISDIDKVIESDLIAAIENTTADRKIYFQTGLAKFYLQKGQYAKALSIIEKVVKSQTYTIENHLLYAEALVNNGKVSEAIQAINKIYGKNDLSGQATKSQILDHIKSLYSNNNKGMKFLNKVRWDETSSWSHYKLLPIPSQEIMLNFNMVQNPGW